MASVQANGITIEYEITGEGTPLLMIMGLGGQLIDWPEEFVDLFVEQGFQVIRFDNRDVGLSTEFDWEPPSRRRALLNYAMRRTPTAGYTIDDMADDAAGLIDALGLSAAHVIGASMGGMIAQSLTIRHPNKVLTLTSIMSHVGDMKKGKIAGKLVPKILKMGVPTRENAVDYFVASGRLIQGPHFDPEAARESAARSLERSWRPEGTGRQVAAIGASPDRTAALGNVKAPTLVLHGILDPLITFSGGEATAAAIRGSRLLAFPDMAHDLPRVRWPEIVSAIVDNTHRAAAV